MSRSILRGDIEYGVHCDSKGCIIGPISKTHAHLEGPRAVLTHYSTWSMIFHIASGRYGIQLKNPKKHDKYGANKWDMGVAGHNCYIKEKGDYRPTCFDENLIKEAKEEIGLKVEICKSKEEFVKSIKEIKLNSALGFIFERFHYKTERDNEWVGLGFIIVPTKKVKYNDGEVIDFKWLTPAELKSFLEENDNYCAPLPLVFKKAEKFRKKYIKKK